MSGSPAIRLELKYGLLAGVGVSLWIYAEFLLGLHTTRLEIGEYSGYFSSLIPLAAIWLVLRRRQAEYGPLFTVARGLWPGLLTAFVGALGLYVFLIVYNLHLNPGWLDHALAWKVARWREAHVAESEIREQITYYRAANSLPWGLLVSTVVYSTVFGGIFALFASVWLTWRAQRAS